MTASLTDRLANYLRLTRSTALAARASAVSRTGGRSRPPAPSLIDVGRPRRRRLLRLGGLRPCLHGRGEGHRRVLCRQRGGGECLRLQQRVRGVRPAARVLQPGGPLRGRPRAVRKIGPRTSLVFQCRAASRQFLPPVAAMLVQEPRDRLPRQARRRFRQSSSNSGAEFGAKFWTTLGFGAALRRHPDRPPRTRARRPPSRPPDRPPTTRPLDGPTARATVRPLDRPTARRPRACATARQTDRPPTARDCQFDLTVCPRADRPCARDRLTARWLAYCPLVRPTARTTAR